MLEAAQNEERLWYQERLELVERRASQAESKPDQCRRQLRDLRAKTMPFNMSWTSGTVWSLAITATSEGYYGTARGQYDGG